MANVDDLRIEHAAPTARARRGVPISISLLFAALAATGGYFLHVQMGQQDVVDTVEQGRRSTEPASDGRVTQNPGTRSDVGFSAGGYIEVTPPGPTVVSSIVAGKISEIHAVEGTTVSAGDVMAVLDDSLYRQEISISQAAVAVAKAKLDRLEAGYRLEEIEEAKANLEQVQARVRQAKLEVDRKTRLLEIGTGTQKSVEAAQAELEVAHTAVSAQKVELERRQAGYRKEDIVVARAELATAQAELARAKWRQESCRIKAPHDGVVLELFTQVGQWLAPGDGTDRAGSILTIAHPTHIQAWVDVNQRDSGRVFVGQAVALTTDAQPNQQIKGRVARILPKANLQKNTVQVKIEIPAPPPADLRPETSVKVTFLPREPNGATSDLKETTSITHE